MSRSSNLRASSSSGNPYGRTNDDIEAASIGPKTTLNVFVDVVGKDGWDKVPDSCPECGTALREGGKLVTEFFPRHTLQAELEYLFSLDGVERLVEDQQVLHSRQRQRDEPDGEAGLSSRRESRKDSPPSVGWIMLPGR
ncbi:hypothetical protein C361_06399 [Cryptococcus neoformans Tu259-1]|uniref:Uncharacterized protein n=1 Tax=Cryptococcus neoformans Tu259-1 TaxID=1230072 RepID=A0A854Q5S4_CRYNE|nr:hypothetical protein C361_06399 [Cryptococcus neoformans var. grubii Tu259-1]